MSDVTLMVVEDDRLVLATVTQGLRQAGYEVHAADSGEQALELLEQADVDLVVLDIRMPGLSGVELAERLKQREIPFIALTAYSEEDLVLALGELGALCYLVKPVDMSQLIPAIETALYRARELARLRQSEYHLSNALQGDRRVSQAVGLLMERYNLTSELAFERLRGHARSQRRKLAEVAGELVNATDAVNVLNPCETEK